MPQGSIQGAFLFISYASTLDEIVKDLKYNGFADDHSVRKTFKPDQLEHHEEINTIAVFEKCMLDIKCWVDAVSITSQINVNGEQIPRSQMTRYLGAYLDPTLNLKQHIKIKCKQPC